MARIASVLPERASWARSRPLSAAATSGTAMRVTSATTIVRRMLPECTPGRQSVGPGSDTEDACVRLGETLAHLVVPGLLEVAIPLADRRERLRRPQAD